MPRTLAAVASFSSDRAYPFSELSTSSLSSLDPYSDYVGVNISLNNSSPLSFLNGYALPNGWQNRFLFSLLHKHLHSGGLQLSAAPLQQEVLPTAAGRKYSNGSFPLTSSPSMTLTHPPFSIAPPLTSPLLPLLLPFLAPGKCFRTWVLTIYQFFYPSLSLRSFAPTSVPLPSTFKMLTAMTLPPTLTFTVLLQSILFLFPLLLFSTSLALNAVKSSIPFGRIKCHPKAWWSAEVESAVSKRRKAFVVAQGSDEDHQAYISASRCASSVIAKTKAEAWQTTCSSNQTLKQYTLFSALSLVSFLVFLLSQLPQLFFSQGTGFDLCRLPEIPLFCF